MTKKIETTQQIWKNLSNEWNKIFDNFRYFDDPNKTLFLNIIIAEAIKSSKLNPLTCQGLLNQINSDISDYVRHNLNITLGNQEVRKYVG